MKKLMISGMVFLCAILSPIVNADNVISNDVKYLRDFEVMNNEKNMDLYPGQSVILHTEKPGSQATHYLAFTCYYQYKNVGTLSIVYKDNIGVIEVSGRCVASKDNQTYIITPQWNRTPTGMVIIKDKV